MGYDARAFVAGAPDNAPASVAVADEPAASSTRFVQQRRPIDATDQGNVWAVSDPLAVVPPSGGPGFTDGGNGIRTRRHPASAPASVVTRRRFLRPRATIRVSAREGRVWCHCTRPCQCCSERINERAPSTAPRLLTHRSIAEFVRLLLHDHVEQASRRQRTMSTSRVSQLSALQDRRRYLDALAW
jgi:hypothetical protein